MKAPRSEEITLSEKYSKFLMISEYHVLQLIQNLFHLKIWPIYMILNKLSWKTSQQKYLTSL